MDADLRVRHAVEPVQYRVFAETPFSEVFDLMVRRGIHAVPVVGERYGVLGIITAGDILSELLKGRRGGEVTTGTSGKELAARDIMTRTVLCIAEDQLLSEAAQMMVNRDVEQLPVVRDAELVGFLTRDAVLRALHDPSPAGAEPEGGEE